MAKKNFKVIVSTGHAENNQSQEIAQGDGARGKVVRLKAVAGAKYQLQEVQAGQNFAPHYVKTRRVGKDLQILFEDETQPSLILEDYYAVMPEGCNAVVGQAENGNFYEYIPEDPDTRGLIPQLQDGAQAVNVALGGAEVSGSGAALGLVLFNPLLAAAGLAGAAGVAAAAAGGGTATGETSSNQGLKTAIALDPVTGDNVITAAEGQAATVKISGKVTGAYAAGDLVQIELNGKTYTATVAADGSFSVNVAMADLKADPDTQIQASVTGTGGDTAMAAQDYTVETGSTLTQTSLSIDPVATDNVIGQAENTGNIWVTGTVAGKYARLLPVRRRPTVPSALPSPPMIWSRTPTPPWLAASPAPVAPPLLRSKATRWPPASIPTPSPVPAPRS